MSTAIYRVVSIAHYPTGDMESVIARHECCDRALAMCEDLCDKELENYQSLCGDALWPCQFIEDGVAKGYIISPKNEIDEWFFQVRIEKVEE